MDTDGNNPEKALWDLLLEDGPSHVGEASDALARDPSVEMETLSFIKSKLFVLEGDCWMAGAEPLAEAARTLRQSLQGPQPPAEKREETLYEGFEALKRILSAMASEAPDRDALLEDLERFKDLQKTLAARDALQEDSKEATTQDTDLPQMGVWVPNVTRDMVPAFVEECTERLDTLSEKLLALEDVPDDREVLAALFRDLHTVKGSSAFVGLTPLNKVAHKAEDLVGEIRDGKRRADAAAIDALLSAKDTMVEILERAVSERSMADIDLQPLLQSLHNPSETSPPAPAATPRKKGMDTGAPKTHKKPPRGAKNGARATIRVDFGKLDVLLNLVGELVLDRASVHSVLENLESASRALEVTRKNFKKHRLNTKDRHHLVGRASENIKKIHEEMDRVGRIFRELTRELDVSAGNLDFVAGELRDQVMKLRMVPISQVFTKHRRTVRDLAKSLGKKVRLELTGENTELDKMLVEKLDEPLLHMVRNAVDHGIETPEMREKRGKATDGVVRLTARHQGGQLVVEVSDDGKGLDPEKIKAKAVEKNLLSAEEASELDEASSLRLIFSPGFSTAGKVTHLSGRGVGMDVVHETVRRLRGSIEVTSTHGAGTTLSMALPLTLAIRQVLLMQVGGELFALPLDHVERTLELDLDSVSWVGNGPVMQGEAGPLPLLDVSSILGYTLASEKKEREQKVVCVQLFAKSYGLVCDGLEGRHEIVVKTLGDLLVQVPCAVGATLVGERVVIILDLPALINRWESGSTRAQPPGRSPSRKTRGRRVLLVEDSPPTRSIIRDQFKTLGFEVLEASDGQKALEIASEEPLDLVSTDARMPHMDGYALAKSLRKRPKTRSIPILMISARDERIDKVRGFDAGIDLYLVKPTDITHLSEAVERLFQVPHKTPEEESP